AYPGAIKQVFAVEVTPPRTGRPGRPAGPRKEVPQGLNYATIQKRRERGRLVEVLSWLVMGAWAAVVAPPGGARGARRTSRCTTPPTGTATPGRLAGRTASARTTGCTRR